MPHLLIAARPEPAVGLAATDDSVDSFQRHRDDVRLILVDPKMLELSVYENIPHLLVPVVVDPQKAASALLWATQEMEGRYLRMRELGVRNIDGYNQALASGTSLTQAQDGGAERAGVRRSQSAGGRRDRASQAAEIVIVIDELATCC